MFEAQSYFYGTGRRKSSVARVRVYNGTGKITINDRDIDDYFGLETLKLIVRQPLNLTGTADKFDIVCRVAGGGVTGQAGAIRHGISRALLQFDGELRGQLKKAGCEERAQLPFQKAILERDLPYTIGGGIGQSRICMFYLRKAHIGEVQCSIWPKEVREEADRHGIILL